VMTLGFHFNFTNHFETPFSDEIRAIAPQTNSLVPPDATWEVWQLTTNAPSTRLGLFQAPFSSLFTGQYPSRVPPPNNSWPINTMRSNNIALVLPNDWTNETQLAQVKYAIAIDDEYQLYLNHSTNFIDSTNHFPFGVAIWPGLKSFEDVAPGLLHGGTNIISVVTGDLGDFDYFSMVVTTNGCGQ